MNEPRKASEIILDLEAKIDQLILIVKTQDYNIKLLSNKMNEMIGTINNLPVDTKMNAAAPKFTATSTEENKSIFISKEDQIPIENNPLGFRRTSRPETFEEKSVPKPPQQKISLPKQEQKQTKMAPQSLTKIDTNKKIPVQQRITNKEGKAIFNAEIEITENNSRETIYKGRTNSVGKWSAPLSFGQYQVHIRKSEAATKEKIDITQNLNVDGTKNPLDLPIMVVK